MKREFLQLAHKYDGQHIGGWWYSEKLDGERCFWDGGITRGLFKEQVPWANCAKDARYVQAQVASGLWSRYGNVIQAPKWWLDSLPLAPLDGELYCSLLQRQEIHSAIKKLNPIDREWKGIKLVVFDSPPYETVLANGVIDNINYQKVLKGCVEWVNNRAHLTYRPRPGSSFKSVHTRLLDVLSPQGNLTSCHLHNQIALPCIQGAAKAIIENKLSMIEAEGGEGLMVRNPDKPYTAARVHHMLKVKSFEDAEGTVIGYITGRETEKGSKLLGMMGAMVLRLDDGNQMELSGFTEEERRLTEIKDEYSNERPTARDWAIQYPESKLPDCYEAVHFHRGERVSFKYRGINNSGVPNEARYWRKE
jgi:DNA ligase-1